MTIMNQPLSLTGSIFRGKLVAVDRYLVERGRMRHITSESDVAAIPVCKKERQERLAGSHVVPEIVESIVGTL